MFEFSEEQRTMERMFRDFLEKNLAPKVEAFEEGKELPFGLMREMARTFGIDEMVRAAFEARRKRKAEAAAAAAGGGAGAGGAKKDRGGEGSAASFIGDPLLTAILHKEMSRISPSFALSFGASAGLAGGTIISRGTDAQREKYGLPIMAFEKVGAWAITEPSTGSDAFALRTTAAPDGKGGYRINGAKTFITNAPYADIMVIYCKIDRGDGAGRADKRLVYPFVFEKGHQGITVSKPMKKMGMRGSPTGEIALDDVHATSEHLLGGEEKSSRDQAKDVFAGEREGVGPMALGIIERCLEESVKYAVQRQQFGKPIGRFQLVQEKLARMYVAYENVKNHVFHQCWANQNKKQTWRSVCATKFETAHLAVDVAMDAVQLMGGYGYMQEYHVERLARDAKLLMIGGGTSDIQLLNIARDLLREAGLEVSISET
ncbi:MAG: acyl-CoA/acyl-ACP dehydrogenase [Planctomycetes bacterium]|nr:acyl-CoA/acyl-ACP dehydrogenase [Planctomycetota bacterium]